MTKSTENICSLSNSSYPTLTNSFELLKNWTLHFLADDWKERVRDEEVFCPVCGHTATSDHWLTQGQLKYCESHLMVKFMPKIDGEIKRMTKDFNRGMPKGGLISMSMSYKTSRPVAIVPLAAADLMQQRYICEACAATRPSVRRSSVRPEDTIPHVRRSKRLSQQFADCLKSEKPSTRG